MIEILVNNLQIYLHGSTPLAFLAAYIGGVLVSFTPCTYPLLPVTIGFIGSQDSSTRLKAFILSLAYVCGLAITYSLLGLAAALSGKIFGQMQTTTWTYLIMANLCLFMGLSMLDVFRISVPVPQKVVRIKCGKKGLLASLLLGATSGVIIGPCTAPVLAVVLGYVAMQTNLVLGIGLLFVFAFGMGTLLLIAGFFAGFITSLPRSGAWMTKINHLFGWILIGAAEYFLYTAGTLAF